MSKVQTGIANLAYFYWCQFVSNLSKETPTVSDFENPGVNTTEYSENHVISNPLMKNQPDLSKMPLGAVNTLNTNIAN